MQILPNAYQKPNIYTDQLAYLLTPEENLVLDRAIREILGWAKRIGERKAPIALSVFVEGQFNEDGSRRSWGCGLCTNAVRRALDTLDKYRILVKTGTLTNDGQPYWLQDDEDVIDWNGLEERRAKLDEKNARRTRKATAAAMNKRQGLSSDDTHTGVIVPREGVTSDDRQGVTSDDRQGVTSDDNNENQLKPIKTIEEKSGATSAQPPDFLLDQFTLSIKAIQARHFTRKEWSAILEAEQARGDTARKSLVTFVENKLSVNQHPAVQVYREEAHYYPPAEWGTRIVAAVGANGRLDLWREVVAAYVGSGWNPRNVKAMLEYFQRGEIPGTTPAPPRSSPPPPRTQADEALAASAKARMERLVQEKPKWMQ